MDLLKYASVLGLVIIGLYVLIGTVCGEELNITDYSIIVLDGEGQSHGGGLDPKRGIGQSVYQDDKQIDVWFGIKTINEPHYITAKWVNESGLVYKEQSGVLENWGNRFVKGTSYTEKIIGSNLAQMPGLWYVMINESDRNLVQVWFRLENTSRPKDNSAEGSGY